jgi:translocation and assembly module TamB
LTQRNKLLITIGASLAGLIAVVVIAALIIVQTQWFANFVRQKVIATIEDSTGGKAEIGSFEFDWSHLDVRIRNFVLHGAEPANADPLARIALLELRLKLFSGFSKAVDLNYLGVESPRVNLIVNAGGATNIPEPKLKSKPSGTSPLRTVVDLAVNQFKIENGVLAYSQQKTAFSARGQNLRALLNYNLANPGYSGNLSISPLLIASAANPPLNVNVNLPVSIDKDTVTLTGARLSTPLSQILLSGSLTNLNAPKIAAQVKANFSLQEAQRSFDLPLDTTSPGLPKFLTAEVSATVAANNINLQTAHASLGNTTFQASGNNTIQFNGNLALGQLAQLFKVVSPQISGDLALNGNAKLDANNNYLVDGNINSHGLAIRSGTTRLSNVSLSSPFHADPFLISLDGLKLNALGGALSAKVFIEKMQLLSAEATLRNFSLPLIAPALTGHPLGYDGTIDGSLKATSDLNAKGSKGLRAQARLVIAPGVHGVPLAGRLNADYNGAADSIDVGNSYLAMPNSRLDLSGALNKLLQVNLVSHNLNDFLPAANLKTLPVFLKGGSATISAQISGNLAAPKIIAHAAIDRFQVRDRLFDQLALDLNATRSGAAISNGTLARHALHADFNASVGLLKWQPQPRSPLTANLTLRDGDLGDLLTLAGENTPASGQVTAGLHINGTYGDPLGNANFQVNNGVAFQQPFNRILANVDLAHQLITLSNLQLDAAGGNLTANGTFRHPADSFSFGHADFHVRTNNLQLANFKALQQKSPGTAGNIGLSADAAADISKTGVSIASINADLSAQGLRLNNQDAGSLTATARTSNGSVNYSVRSNFAGSDVKVAGRTALTKDYVTQASANIRNLAIEKVLRITGQNSIPARGQLSADASVAGTLAAPDATLDLTLAKANIYQEPVNQLHARARYTNTLLDISAFELNLPAGTLSLAANYAHPSGNLDDGKLLLHVNSGAIDLSRIEHAKAAELALAGHLKLAADLAATVKAQKVLLSNVNAGASASALRLNNRDLGKLTFTAQTKQAQVTFNLDSELAQTQIHASGESQLTGNYPTRANLQFSNIKYSNIAPFIPSDTPAQPAFDAQVQGQASINGPLLNTDALTGKLELTHLDLRTNPRSSPAGAPGTRTIAFQNDGPLVFSLAQSILKVEQFKIQGPKTSLTASGAFNLKNNTSPLGLTLKADADLAVLQDADRDFYSSGNVLVDATLRGSPSQPLLNGRIELKNANINYAAAPNGLSNGNGVIALNGASATIQNLTGESGGGKISIGGFVGFSPSALVYNLQARATKVRTRYSGASVTSSANITLTGNTHRSLLSGTVTIQRIAYGASSDVGSFLSTASVPPSTPTAPSPLLAGMRLDIRVVTAPDLRVVSSYSDKLDITSTLTIRGTASNPGVLGRLNITNGQLEFFGNTYTVNTGSVSFYNPNDIQPVIDFSLETIAQGVDVNIGVTGPVNDLKLSYRSDPPLSFEQIVQLLATNTTPSDPTIAAHQPAPEQQSVSQLGESAILGQAVANPLASRVKRVFGLTQFKIDPSFSGSNGQPGARVTLQQKIANNLTFTYITDVTQTNSEIVRVQLDLTSKLSAVALRDYNGNVSVEFFYKFQKR